MALAQLVGEIDQSRGDLGLSSAVRTYLLNYYRSGALAAQSDVKPD